MKHLPLCRLEEQPATPVPVPLSGSRPHRKQEAVDVNPYPLFHGILLEESRAYNPNRRRKPERPEQERFIAVPSAGQNDGP